MISKTNSELLNDTLKVVQLARQAALMRGNSDSAGKFSSVAESLHQLVVSSTPGSPSADSPTNTLLSQEGFDVLISALQTAAQSQLAPSTNRSVSSEGHFRERNQMISAMASGGMSEIDIARQLGVTRDEIRAILALQKHNSG